MCPICGSQEENKKDRKKMMNLIQNQELLRLRLTHEEKVFYTDLYYDNAVSGKVTRNNFLPLLGMLGTQIAEEFADRIFLAFSSNKEDITLCEYLKYIDIYHYGDDRERCRVTCKLIDKESKGIITFEDFKSYINLIMNAVKKVNGGSNSATLSENDIKDLFFHISKEKESFTYQDFEDIYTEKPELVSWFDYFKNNKEDLLLVIDENVRLLLDKINGFLSYFMADLFRVLDNEEEIDLQSIIQKVFDYSNEFEILRQNFLKRISEFNIRSTFEKLQNNNKDQKTNDLINALQKKIFNDEPNHVSSSMFDVSDINNNCEPSKFKDKKESSDHQGNINGSHTGGFLFNKNKNLNINTKKTSEISPSPTLNSRERENSNVDKFFENIKVRLNLVRTISRERSEFLKSSSKIKNSGTNNSNEENYINNLNGFLSSDKDYKNNLNIKDLKSKNDRLESCVTNDYSHFLNIRGRNNDFTSNFMRQKTAFDNKMFKFGSGKSSKYESGLEELQLGSTKGNRKSIYEVNCNNTIKDETEENYEEDEDEEHNTLKSKVTKKRPSSKIQSLNSAFKTIKSNILQNQKTQETNNLVGRSHSVANDIKSHTQLIENEDNLIYDQSDYDNTIVNDYIDSDSKNSQIKNNISTTKLLFTKNSLTTSHTSQLNIKGIKTTAPKKESIIHKKRGTSKALRKFICRVNELEKESSGLKQLLFCSRVILENASDVCQTFSSCYKWIGENYLESEIKKVIKEAKLKEKQKKDKEKYGNAPKKGNQARKVIKASDQSFKVLLNMIMGIQIAVQSIQNFHIKPNEDLSKYLTKMIFSIQTINFGKKCEEYFILKEFAGIIFNNIRLYLGYDKDDFISSISPQDFITELMISNQTIFEELCSTGKSGSLLYYTRDGQFIVKTIKKHEYKFLKQILPEYFIHLKQNPLSLLPKFLGCYVLTRKIKKKREKIYFIVMVNVFATSKQIHIRFDLKGSKIGRRVLTGDKTDEDILAKGDLALKDLDFEKLNQKVYVGEKKDIIVKQIKSDAEFLCKIGSNDYSLLLGIHTVNKEKNNTNITNSNIKNSVIDKINNSIIINGKEEEKGSHDSLLSNESANQRAKIIEKVADFDDGGILSETGNEIYFFGIIDILTKYNWVKKAEHFTKMIRYCSNEMSCTPPENYKDRFCSYMSGIIQKKGSSALKFKNTQISQKPTIISSMNNNSSNIILHNTTNNVFNIVNNNNTINVNNIMENNNVNQAIKTNNSPSKNEKVAISAKYATEEIIKEESIDTKMDNENNLSVCKSRNDETIIKNRDILD